MPCNGAQSAVINWHVTEVCGFVSATGQTLKQWCISNQHPPHHPTPHPPEKKKIKYIKRIYIKQDVYFQRFIKTFTNTDGDTVHLNITVIVTLGYKVKAWNDVDTKFKKIK